ncbi:uncharacterized protein LOC129579327 [Sitodiplosis mosellana]|uniref:uncharacterized protein LOC129579327 n=1 Tax=Sitodiplosis mosellana TaxID=263140 RepID=UPI0024439EFD|nr:uncharacterized protein LOC129579327 [Sitodiplosis mosellana]
MSIKSAIFISTALFCSHILAEDSGDSTRKGKFLDITGYLSGFTDFHAVPFWKHWNALLQVNVQKNKHKHNGVYILPSSYFYSPYDNPYAYYYPPNYPIGGGLIHPNSLQRPMPLLFDEYKQPTTTLAPLRPNPIDKPKFDIDTNDLLDGSLKKSDKHVGFLNSNVRDDRKTHKRDIVHKTKTDDEVVATVMEITEDTTTATTISPTSEPVIDTTTEPSEPPTTEKTAENIEATTPSIPSSTTEMLVTSVVDPGFQPIGFYYGGTPNDNANYIYFTTPQPFQEIELPTESPNAINERYDWGKFRPSVQYEYRNYRFIPDNHFVPVIGTKQIVR